MGQYAGQIFLGSNHYSVEIVMEVLLDITLAVLGTLHKGNETGKSLLAVQSNETSLPLMAMSLSQQHQLSLIEEVIQSPMALDLDLQPCFQYDAVGACDRNRYGDNGASLCNSLFL